MALAMAVVVSNVFVINPLKVKDKIHVACLLKHTHTVRQTTVILAAAVLTVTTTASSKPLLTK